MLSITWLTFREALRRWALVTALILGIIFLIIYGIGVNAIKNDVSFNQGVTGELVLQEMLNFMLTAGLYVVNFLTILMTVFSSVNTISGEISTGTIHTLASKPIKRWELLAGKWLGFAVMLTLYWVLMAGGVALVVYMISGFTPPNILQGIVLIWLNIILVLSVCLLGGTYLSTLANGILVFGLFGLAFIGGWVEQIGSMLNNQTAVNIGIITSLIFPSDLLWRMSASSIQSELVTALGISPFTSNSMPSPLMIVYSIGYILFASVLALRKFNRRDI